MEAEREAGPVDVNLLSIFVLLLVPLAGVAAAIYLLATRRRRG